MDNLSHRDLIELLSAIETLHSDADPLTLPERTLQAVLKLIPNEITSFDGFGSDSNYNGYLWYSPAGTVSEERVEILGTLIHEHPILPDVLPVRRNTTAKISEYMSLGKFQETALYHEFYKHIGGDSQMITAFNVSPELFVSCSLHRSKMDFSERDLEVLKHLSPHLIAAFRNAQILKYSSERNTQIPNALDSIGYGILTIDSEMKVCEQNLTAIRMLHEYFSFSNGLPEELLNYIKHSASVFTQGEVYLPPTPLIVRKIDSILKIRLSPQFQTQSTVIFLEEIKEPNSRIFMRLGLTKTESEILFLISKGKTDQEISQIQVVSIRTVHKHRENIFRKLGVENRTAATSLAIDLINLS